jgi:LemA protein
MLAAMNSPTSLLAVSPLLVGGEIVAVLELLVPAIYVIAVYNGLKRSQVRAQNAFSQIDVQLKRRFDLIPNLVEAVKGYMAHERGTLDRMGLAADCRLLCSATVQHGRVVVLGDALTGA